MKRKVGCPCGVLFGGNANNSANAGLAYANSNNTPSNSNTNIGSHLCLQNVFKAARPKRYRGQRPCLLAENFK